MKARILPAALIVVAFGITSIMIGCAGPTQLPRSGWTWRWPGGGVEMPDGTGKDVPGRADPRAQDDFNKNREAHEEHIVEIVEQSKVVDETISDSIAPSEIEEKGDESGAAPE